MGTVVIVDGIQGPPGPKGDPGDPGDGKLSYFHTQASVASVWTITHNMDYKPNVTAFNSANEVVVGEILHSSVNSLTITFSSAFSGCAVLS